MSESVLTGFYDRWDVRLISAAQARENERVVSSVFYGYSAEVLSQWCCVSLHTAITWKKGEASPSAPALRLFELHRDRRVLAAEAWGGWRVSDDGLADPEGNVTTQEQLRAYHFVYQLAAELAREDPEAHERLLELQRLEVG